MMTVTIACPRCDNDVTCRAHTEHASIAPGTCQACRTSIEVNVCEPIGRRDPDVDLVLSWLERADHFPPAEITAAVRRIAGLA